MAFQSSDAVNADAGFRFAGAKRGRGPAIGGVHTSAGGAGRPHSLSLGG